MHSRLYAFLEEKKKLYLLFLIWLQKTRLNQSKEWLLISKAANYGSAFLPEINPRTCSLID